MADTTKLVRMRNAAIAVKIETTAGTDAIAGTPAAGDCIKGEVTLNFEQNQIPNPVLNGTLDAEPPIPGGLRPVIRMRLPLFGSGTPGTAPVWGRLMQCATMKETITAAAIGAPTLATAGTTTSATLQAPFAATAQLYRGMPLDLTVGPIALTAITDYTVGRVATVGETLATAISATTLAQIPINVLYGPTSDEAIFKSATCYYFADGLRWRFAGFQGTWGLELTTGGIGFLTFEGRASFIDLDTVAVPAGAIGGVTLTPPRFVAGKCQLGRTLARVRTLTVNMGVVTVLPDNPEEAEGYDAAVPTARGANGNMDPLMDTDVAVARFNAFKNGTIVPLFARIGSVPGNRFMLVLPGIVKSQMNPGDREGLGADAITFAAAVPEAGAFLCAF